ncbi:ParB/RepB/Spo0J family partition protein [Bellilinea caldifistulae]|nr:ParB/RepB/Spo0J family partition protein [Bellilinea caldifistulae]GAP11765.1 ParB/RepB/Spo0J family partition protein [Bellilinea caldifistulae]
MLRMLFPIYSIFPNPWQPRTEEDAEHIEALAASILADGLLQEPVGRLCDASGKPVSVREVMTRINDPREIFEKLGCDVQLAFGHSRLAAYRLLDKRCDNGQWGEMPVRIKDISDEEMFRLAVSENIQRRDLTPIEEARAMRRYREEFGKTSREIGELFGISESAVRNKMRLLELPEKVQLYLAGGVITEHFARRLLSVQKILPAERIEYLADEIAANHYDKPEQVDNIIRAVISGEKHIQRLHTYWQNNGKANDLFPLDWESGKINYQVTISDFKKCYRGPAEITLPYQSVLSSEETITLDIEQISLLASAKAEGINAALANQLAEELPEAVEVYNHLKNPPTCSKCPFYLTIAGEGFCGRKVCYERKKARWIELELERVSTETGISIYDPIEDGNQFVQYVSWGELGDYFKSAIQEKSPHLRLKGYAGGNAYTTHTGSPVVQIVSVEPAVIQRAAELESIREDDERWVEEQERQIRNLEEADEYINQIAPIFAGYLFGKWNTGSIEFLIRAIRLGVAVKPGDENYRSEVMTRLGWYLLQCVIGNVRMQGVEATKKYALGLAKEIGLPEERLLSVSVETEAA